MRKIFTTIALAAGLLIPSLANAANEPSITSITPVPGSIATGKGYFETEQSGQAAITNANLFSFNIATNSKNSMLYITSGALKYTNSAGENIEENLPNLGTSNVASTAGRKLWGTSSSNNNNARVQVNLTNIKEAGASEFTVTLQMTGATSGYQSKNFNDPDMAGVTVEGEYVSITFLTGLESSGGDSGNTGDVDNTATEFTWNETITASASKPNYTLPSGDFTSGGFYVKTNSSTNLGNFAYIDNSYSTPISFDETIPTDDGLVYVKNDWFDMPIYLHYLGTNPVEFTFVQGAYQQDTTDPTPSVDGTPIQWNEIITPGSRGDKQYTFVGKGTKAEIITNNNTDLTIGRDGILFKNGTEAIAVTPVLKDDEYVYYTPELEEGVTYQLAFYCPATNFTFYIKETTEDAPVKEPKEVFTGNESTWEAEQVYYYEATQDGTIKLTISYAPEATVEGGMVYTDVEHLNLLTGVTEGTEGGYPSYEFTVEEGETYYFYFTTPTYVMATLTLKQEDVVDQPTYMNSLPTLYFDNDPVLPALLVYWNEAISTINEETTVEATLITPDNTELEVTMNLSSYWPDAQEGDQTEGENALLLLMASYIETYGAGNYTIQIASGVVMNADEELNNAIDDTFTVEELPTLSDVPATLTISGDQIVITWNNEPIEAYNPDDDDIQIMPADYSKEAWRLNTENGVTITEDSIVIEIAALELEEGVSYEILVPENYVLVGVDGLGNEMIDETFTAEASGVASLNSVNDSNAIYNLNGVRVDSKKLHKGIYILNGKKVLVK